MTADNQKKKKQQQEATACLLVLKFLPDSAPGLYLAGRNKGQEKRREAIKDLVGTFTGDWDIISQYAIWKCAKSNSNDLCWWQIISLGCYLTFQNIVKVTEAEFTVHYLCQMVILEDFEDYEIKSINDEWNEDGEEGETRKHGQQR